VFARVFVVEEHAIGNAWVKIAGTQYSDGHFEGWISFGGDDYLTAERTRAIATALLDAANRLEQLSELDQTL